MNDENRLHSPDTTPTLFDLEEPIRMARGQAEALHAVIASADMPGLGCAEALERQLEALQQQWTAAVRGAGADSSAPPPPETISPTPGESKLGNLNEVHNLTIGADASLSQVEQHPDNYMKWVNDARERLSKAFALITGLRQLEELSVDRVPSKPLPEETGRTLGPGHIDMAFERLEEARGIAGLLYSALESGGELPGADVACMGQRRLLEEAEEHLNAFYAEVRQERQNQNGGGS